MGLVGEEMGMKFFQFPLCDKARRRTGERVISGGRGTVI